MRRDINLLIFYFNQKRSFTLKRLIYEPLDIYQTYSYCYFFLFIKTLKKTAKTKFTLFNEKKKTKKQRHIHSLFVNYHDILK